VVLERLSGRPLADLSHAGADLWVGLGNALRERNAGLATCHPILSRRSPVAVCPWSRYVLTVTDILVMMIFGFPAAVLSILLSVIGVLTEKVWLVIIGAVLFIPFSYYLSGSPNWAGLPILLPGFQIGSAVAVREKSKLWAWLLLVPALLTVLWVGSLVLIYT
jgi:hypothetical protein